jgi:hypothetical protein
MQRVHTSVLLLLYRRYSPVWVLASSMVSKQQILFRGEVVSSTLNPQPAGPGTTFCLIPSFDLSNMGDATRRLHSRQHSSPGH